MNTTSILTTVLDAWKAGVDAHEPEAVAEVFTDGAIFQGLHPYSIGPVGVAEYYASQPLGMKADYEILESRQLSDDLVLGYLKVAFSFVDRPTLEVFLSILARGNDNTWKIDHYQVSKLS
ncbi:hypothetical protein [Kribbella sp. NPDC051620]|uniref:hypothetical protein n=1 Tax=Kribbella sp. NPDC051620 TaxID=3364120 RepID=UPI0037BCD8A2